MEERDRHPPGNTDKPSSLTDHGSDSQTQRPQLKVVIPDRRALFLEQYVKPQYNNNNNNNNDNNNINTERLCS